MSRRTALARALTFVVGIAILTWFVRSQGLVDVASLRARVAAAGLWGPVVFAVLYAVSCLLPIPRIPLSILGGALFGLGTGSGAAYAGSMMGATLGYVVATHLGRGVVEEFGGRRIRWIEEKLSDRAIRSVALLRLIPISPFVGVNYAAGALAVPWGHYLVGTALGVIPGTVFYTGVGAFGVS